MKPLKVEFQAFGPYVGYETVDFEELARHGLFLICGKTGSGKTMILDAMTFALFGKSSGNGRDVFEAMRCTNAPFDAETFVCFEFENGGEQYRFERRLKRKTKNLSFSCNASRKDENGVWQPLFENPKKEDLNAKAEELIGLSYDQFRQVIVLPQGQFEKLLTSKSEDKEKILISIFGEEKWQRMADCFFEDAEERKNGYKEIQNRIAIRLGEEECKTMSDLEQLVKQKKEEESSLDEENKKADHEKIMKEQQALLALAARFGDMHKAERKVKDLAEKKEERAKWECSLGNAKRAEKLRRLIEIKADANANLEKRKKDESAAVKDAEEKKKAAEKAGEMLKAHLEKEKEISGKKEQMIRFEGKREDYSGIDRAEKELSEKKRIAKEAAEAEETAKKKCEAVTAELQKIQKEHGSLQREHEALLNRYIAGIAAVLAKDLEEGCPCPVCGNTQHPHKAEAAEDSVGKEDVEKKKKAVDKAYGLLNETMDKQTGANKLVQEKHAAVEEANTELTAFATQLESRKKNLVPGIASLKELETEIEKLGKEIALYERRKEELINAEKAAKEALAGAGARIEEAAKERGEAEKKHFDTLRDEEAGLKENGFASEEEATALMMSEEERDALAKKITAYDSEVKSAEENRKELEKELEGKEEPDEEKCRETLAAAESAKDAYLKKKAVLSKETERLAKKLAELAEQGDGIEEKLHEAEEDLVFAKKLRGDTGTGLQRYVLGIMFSSVITAANRMLEMVHGGRYRLFRSDEKVQGSNKRGLELKVFDRESDEQDGRFVSTLSGGEKFLASLALAIGLSAVAGKSGIRIEALFIDEGFGSLDNESIDDAMSVLNSVKEANGLVGIISHVQIMQDQISCKLRVDEREDGSHIVYTVG
ncbi:MAG: SMC family ATPase [Lachnospiraceae bacterium]|nr:SMC family ATPase [Lachnospiraceae bacterium]